MPKIKFPVVKRKRAVFPADHICPWCRKRKLGAPPGMAILNAGAMRSKGKDRYEMAIGDAGFFSLIWHSNYVDRERYDDASVEIAEHVDTGQFDFYFCSTDCLRGFLNYCVDELERRRKLNQTKQASAKQRKRKPKRRLRSKLH